MGHLGCHRGGDTFTYFLPEWILRSQTEPKVPKRYEIGKKCHSGLPNAYLVGKSHIWVKNGLNGYKGPSTCSCNANRDPKWHFSALSQSILRHETLKSRPHLRSLRKYHQPGGGQKFPGGGQASRMWPKCEWVQGLLGGIVTLSSYLSDKKTILILWLS